MCTKYQGGDLVREELILRKQSVLEEIVKELRVFVFLQGNLVSEFADVGTAQMHPTAKTASEVDEESLSELDTESIKYVLCALVHCCETHEMIQLISLLVAGVRCDCSDRPSKPAS